MAANYLPDLRFIPDNLPVINSSTKLNTKVSMSRFLKGITLDHITSLEGKVNIARNLLPHAQLIRMVEEDGSEFANYTLEVVEGVYKPGPNEKITLGSINDLKSKGRAVVYELKLNGNTVVEKTDDLAIWIKTFFRNFDKLYLDYDQYDPSGVLNAQIIITTPNIPSSYRVRFKKEVTTTYNNEVQSTNEIVTVDTAGITPTTSLIDNTSTVQTNYWTVGDSQALRAARAAGDPWGTKAREGLTSKSDQLQTALNTISENSVVVISLGEDEIMNNTSEPVSDIVARIAALVTYSKNNRGHDPVFLLLPVGNTVQEQRRRDFRGQMQSALTRYHIIDLENPEFSLAADGRHATEASYITALGRLFQPV